MGSTRAPTTRWSNASKNVSGLAHSAVALIAVHQPLLLTFLLRIPLPPLLSSNPSSPLSSFYTLVSYMHGTSKREGEHLASPPFKALLNRGIRADRSLAAAQAQHQVQGRLLLDVVVGQGAAVLQLLAREDQTLLVRGDACAGREEGEGG